LGWYRDGFDLSFVSNEMSRTAANGGYANGKRREFLDDGLVEYEVREFRLPVVEAETCALFVLVMFIS
jgi:hypothetical protein